LVEVVCLVLDPLVTGGLCAERVELLEISKEHLSPIFGLGQSYMGRALGLNSQLILVEVVWLVLDRRVTGGLCAERVELLGSGQVLLSTIFRLSQSSGLWLPELNFHVRLVEVVCLVLDPLVTGGLCAERVELLEISKEHLSPIFGLGQS